MKAHETCESCGQPFPLAQLTGFDGSQLCPDCLESGTLFCARCGTRIWREDNAGNPEAPLCQSCYDRFYINCSNCGRVLHQDEACFDRSDNAYCSSCYHRVQRYHSINDYYYKPVPIFCGKGTRFFGVELEIDEGGEDSENASELMEIANRDAEIAYCKHDGSLHDGFEIVTHPMTLDFHRNEMPWEALLQRAVSLGYLSHQAGTCGLHVHVNRTAFGSTEVRQDAAIARILYFFEKQWDELLKFSRRTSQQLNEWAMRYGYKEQPCEILDHAKKGCHNGRYSCVNLQNRDTIEFRIFRGTLKWNTLIATLQLVNWICDVAISFSDEEIKAMPWTTFVTGCQSPELVQYLKERRLYVNDPVTREEEV
ncbi:amidoligase family protein [Parabacteroides goldsteinii]|uniref:amidoligase family protein n=1 Tax=Parabacteroides goldsteinii TaxID=328812 RepID=UPI00259B0940|nr:amidoligase family protein [Parabacteroides goldsteinii]